MPTLLQLYALRADSPDQLLAVATPADQVVVDSLEEAAATLVHPGGMHDPARASGKATDTQWQVQAAKQGCMRLLREGRPHRLELPEYGDVRDVLVEAWTDAELPSDAQLDARDTLLAALCAELPAPKYDTANQWHNGTAYVLDGAVVEAPPPPPRSVCPAEHYLHARHAAGLRSQPPPSLTAVAVLAGEDGWATPEQLEAAAPAAEQYARARVVAEALGLSPGQLPPVSGPLYAELTRRLGNKCREWALRHR